MSIRILKQLATVLLAILMLNVIPVLAEESKSSDYKPSDVVLVVDTSGSMAKADPDRLVMQAMRMFSNMMPASGSRIAIVGFNENASVYTKAADGSGSLEDMEQLQGWEELHQIFDTIEYKGDTAIGNGLLEATNLLAANERPDAQKAIVLFSDGVDDLKSEVDYQQAQDNLTDAKLWSKQNNCPIFVIGFNYQLQENKESLGKEGIDKINSIAETSGGKAYIVNDISEIQRSLDEISGAINQLEDPIPIGIPGDGAYHETTIVVTYATVEMDIRIDCNTEEALQNGEIRLIDPDKNEVPLENNESTRYDVEKTAASIKQIKPKTGPWTIAINNIVGDNISISFLNHFQLSMTADMTVPQGNPENTAFKDDKVIISAAFSNKDGSPVEQGFYSDVTEATAVVTPRGEGEQPVTVPLTYDGSKLTGEYTATAKSVCDILVTVKTQYIKKSESLVLENGNRPLTLVQGKEFENQKLNVRKTAEIDDIYSYVTDPEGDPITASIVTVDNPECADITVDGDKIRIDAKKWGSALVTVGYTDEQGNRVYKDFKLNVTDWLKVFLMTLGPIILVILAILIAVITAIRTRIVRGTFTVNSVMTPDGNYIKKDYSFEGNTLPGISNLKLKDLMTAYTNAAKKDGGSSAVTSLQTYFERKADQELMGYLNDTHFQGTARGKKGVVLILPKKTKNVTIANKEKMTTMKIPASASFHILISLQDNRMADIGITYTKEERGSAKNNRRAASPSSSAKPNSSSSAGSGAGSRPHGSGSAGRGSSSSAGIHTTRHN